MRAFDYEYNVVDIDRGDIVNIKLSNKRFEYHTATKIFYGASNAKQELELETDTIFFVVDKNNSININFIERFLKDGIFVNGVFFKLSRRKLALLKSQLRK